MIDRIYIEGEGIQTWPNVAFEAILSLWMLFAMGIQLFWRYHHASFFGEYRWSSWACLWFRVSRIQATIKQSFEIESKDAYYAQMAAESKNPILLSQQEILQEDCCW